MRPTAIYCYFGPGGQLLRRKIRFEPKTFVWETYEAATDTWVSGAPDKTATATLYNLHLIAAERPATVYCCEGEKDTDALTALGLLAVTSGHAGSWCRHHSEQLHEHGCRHAVVLPDHDDAGEAHAFDVARANLALGIATKIIRLPGLAEHEDVSDFLQHGGTVEQIITLAQRTAWITRADLPPAKPEKPTTSPSICAYDPRLSRFYIETLKLPSTVRGQIKTLCAFHPDANPSLSLDLTKGVWYCHACQEGGGVAAFYVKIAAQNGRVVSHSHAWHRLKATYL